MWLHCAEDCLRSCTRTTETRSRCSTAVPSWFTGSRPTGRSPPGLNTPKTSCKRCRATTATLSQVCVKQLSYLYSDQQALSIFMQKKKINNNGKIIQMNYKGGSILSAHIKKVQYELKLVRHCTQQPLCGDSSSTAS